MVRFRTTLLGMILLVMVMVTTAFAAPVNGTYTSTDLGGALLTGRASMWRPTINSGFPHVLHVQSWDPGTSTLGSQWEVNCTSAPSFISVVDNRVAGVGTMVYTTLYTGGTFTMLSGPWGSGTGAITSLTTVTTDQHVMIGPNSVPVTSVVNGNMSGVYTNGCALTFAIGNGVGVGQTSSLAPSMTKPADYPVFYNGTCNPAGPTEEFGGWGTAITITMRNDCATPTKTSSWGELKTIYR